MVRSPAKRKPSKPAKSNPGKPATGKGKPVPIVKSAKPSTRLIGKQIAKQGGKRAVKPTLKANGRPGPAERRARRRLTVEEADAMFAKLAAAIPIPKSELEFINPYTLLVAVVLSAQATDVGVNRATGPLFAKVSTAAEMVKLGIEGLIPYIKTIGLFNTKAKNVIELSRLLVERHGGEVPRDRAALEALPGVGRKTANVVLNVAFGEPTIAVDTHVFRVSNRTGLAPGDTPLAVELGLLEIVPDRWKDHAHHWLILHGRYTCIARKPKCPECVIKEICLFPGKTTAA
jgi:endonuclease-3